MGNFMSRQSTAVEEADQTTNHAYKYPPRVGNFFGSHFIMGGERFDTPQPESYLFGENADLNFLGNRPTSFPYPPPQANEPTKTLKSLVNIRKESVRFVRIPQEKKLSSSSSSGGDCVSGAVDSQHGDAVVVQATDDEEAEGEVVDGNMLCRVDAVVPPCSYNIEFTFDSDAKCAITIYYFCTEEVSPSGVTLVPRDGLTSETYHYDKGINQYFSQPSHIFKPQLIPEDDLIYNPAKEQFPVAIHCVVEDGNEDCRQSHTTVCVIDHHPESNSYVLRALKQKLFVDGLCYLLQEIYGIENKAVNKSSIDEEIDDHGSECVICMSETRDTLILPCRHLCLCNSCADSLRYQANNCPICRAPFRALLQIRAVQKGVSTHMLHQNTPTSAAGGETTACDVPPGYVPVSLIEALNGPPQYVGRTRTADNDVTDCVTSAISGSGENNKATSPLKPSSQRRPKIKKNASTCTSTSEIATTTNTATNTNNGNGNNHSSLSVVEIESDPKKVSPTSSPGSASSSQASNGKHLPLVQDKLQIVNERHSLKLSKQKRCSSGSGTHESRSAAVGVMDEHDDDDSENEKLSPLLSPGSKPKVTLPQPTKSLKQVVAELSVDVDDAAGGRDSADGVDIVTRDAGGDIGGDGPLLVETKQLRSTSLKKQKRPDMHAHAQPTSTATAKSETHSTAHNASGSDTGAGCLNADDSDYYTPEDPQNSILSPLCPPASERGKSGDPLSTSNSMSGGLSSSALGGMGGGSSHSVSVGHKASAIGVGVGGGVVVGFSGASHLCKKNLHKKSTSVGNIMGPSGGGGGSSTAAVDMKCNNISSLPDMLDSPISGNSASTRSSSDSYSSSSSTKQLLSSNPTTAAANIIVDDKTALQNAVNV